MKRIGIAFILGYGCVAVISLSHYLDWFSAAMGVGFMALYLTPRFPDQRAGGSCYGWATLGLFALYLALPVKTVLYLTLASAMLLFIESFYRKLPPTVPLVIGLISPITEYSIKIFSVPIRLHLSSLAGSFMRDIGIAVTTNGNLLIYKGHEFAVDPACMGLHMLQISLLTGILLMNYYQGVYRRHMRAGTIGLLLILLLVLNILANLARIILLVIFSIAPENPMHGLVGICCWLVYGILPAVPAIRWVASRWGRSAECPASEITVLSATLRKNTRENRLLAWNMMAAVCVTVAVLPGLSPARDALQTDAPVPSISGYSVKRLQEGILKLDNGKSLVYIKPIPDFYYTDHTPMICWEGSGYKFCNLREENISGVSLYEGILRNKDQLLYTAWWYDNGYHRSNGSIEWRWDVMKGVSRYSLINITAAKQTDLDEEVRKVLNTNPFFSLLTGNFTKSYPVKK